MCQKQFCVQLTPFCLKKKCVWWNYSDGVVVTICVILSKECFCISGCSVFKASRTCAIIAMTAELPWVQFWIICKNPNIPETPTGCCGSEGQWICVRKFPFCRTSRTVTHGTFWLEISWPSPVLQRLTFYPDFQRSLIWLSPASLCGVGEPSRLE